MKTIEEQLANAMAQLERQTTEWGGAMEALMALGGAHLCVPVALLHELDAVIQHAQAAAGGVQV